MKTRRDDPTALFESVLQVLDQREAFARGELVVVAVSGGGDSVALLHILNRMRGALGIELHVASLYHGIRGEAGQADLDFVAELATRWGIPYTVGQVDAPQRARDWKMSLEAAARRVRYDFLAQVAHEQGGRRIAVGHHALDQAETIMMNIVRGSGMRGLRGMQIVSELPGDPQLRLIRPLLRLSKADLEAYCQAHELPFRVDPSNADIAFRRNFIRHEVMPALMRINPAALGAFERLSESAAVDEDFIGSQFDATVTPMANVSRSRWQISRGDFAALHPALQRRFVQRAFCLLSGGAGAPSHQLTLEFVGWSRAAAVGGKRDMSADIQLRLDADALFIERKDCPVEYDQYRLIPAGADQPIVADATLALGDIKARLWQIETWRAETSNWRCRRLLNCGCERGNPATALSQRAWAGVRASSKTG